MEKKRLQSNFTTPEQAKRLLELGIPDWTADCYYYEEGSIADDSYPAVVPFDELYEDSSTDTMFSSYVCLPCWSAGRLLDIYLLSVEMETNIKPNAIFFLGDNKSLMENLMEWFETESFDFSKLDEYGSTNNK